MYAMGARRKRINAPAALGHHLGLKGERPMRTLAPNSPNVQSEIDDAFIGAFIGPLCVTWRKATQIGVARAFGDFPGFRVALRAICAAHPAPAADA
jgi:hypothetical protein